MTMEIITGIIIGGAVTAIIMAVLLHRSQPKTEVLESAIAKTLNDSMMKAQEHLVMMTRERLESDQRHAQEDLGHKKDMIGALIEELRKDLSVRGRELKESEDQRIASFSAVTKELELQRQVIHDLRTTTDELKRVLSNNQMRGAFGEQVAENLLKMAGFVIGQDYVFNKEQDHTDTRPDFTLFLPDKTKVNIDVKFPYASLVKMFGTEDQQERDLHRKAFTQDVKQKIKQVTTRDYINPEDKTVDFVILFIPNEMIFSYIYDQLTEVWEDAMQKKVVLAGPFSFTAILRMIKQAYTNFRYQENLHEVIGLIQKFEIEYDKFRESVDSLGSKIDSAAKQFQMVSGTRDRALNRIVDQIKSRHDFPEPTTEKLLEE